MGLRQEHKQRKRLKRRENRKQRKRLKEREEKDPLIGYVATTGLSLLCEGEAGIVAGSEERMVQFMWDILGEDAEALFDIDLFDVQPASFLQLVWGDLPVKAYGFEETAYRRFYRTGHKLGMPLPKADFRDKERSQTKLITISRKDLWEGW